MKSSQLLWLLDSLDPPQRVGPSSLMIMGDGPLPGIAWRDKLFSLGRDVYFPDQYLATLLVGRENWSKDLIHELLVVRQGLAVRIVSQEMMLGWLATRKNPFDEPARVREIWGDHPAYRFLDEDGRFDWPMLLAPEARDERADGPDGNWGAGLLSAAGYRVGEDADYAPARRAALREAYLRDTALRQLPPYRQHGYGRAGSWRRLEAIAQTIRRQIRLSTNHPDNRARTIWQWTQDFHWLKAEFYDTDRAAPRVFDWPTLGLEDE